jgi:Membrane bound beta barrel domain (DUF5777)
MLLFQNKICFIVVFILFSSLMGVAQSMDELMNNAQKNSTEYVFATFKGTKVINGHSIEAPAKGVLQLIFSHRFSAMNNGFYDLFGFDGANMHFGLDYGISDKLVVGLGRSSLQKAYDGYIKYKLLRQSTGASNMPVSVSLLAATAINTLQYTGFEFKTIDRLYYTGQILIAKKINSKFSLQLMPTLVHRNYVDNQDQENDLLAIGFAGRAKLTKRMSLTGEYYYNLPNRLGAGYYNPLAIGIDIETGGHVFQVHFTNTPGMIEHQFIGMTDYNFTEGFKGIRMGFNFSRVFTIVKPRE